jgi:hypothetical protein
MSTSRRGKRRAIARCRLCRIRSTYRATPFCVTCITDAKELARCPDCDSDVIVVVAEDTAGMWAHVAHDETCIRLRYLKAHGLAT